MSSTRFTVAPDRFRSEMASRQPLGRGVLTRAERGRRVDMERQPVPRRRGQMRTMDMEASDIPRRKPGIGERQPIRRRQRGDVEVGLSQAMSGRGERQPIGEFALVRRRSIESGGRPLPGPGLKDRDPNRGRLPAHRQMAPPDYAPAAPSPATTLIQFPAWGEISADDAGGERRLAVGTNSTGSPYIIGGLSFVMSHPKWRINSGFAPDWNCTSIGGDDLECFKKPVGDH